MTKEVIEALHTIEAWAEEDPKKHVFFAVLYDKSDSKTDTFVPAASGSQKDIILALAYMTRQNPEVENILKAVVATLSKYKEFMDKHNKK